MSEGPRVMTVLLLIITLGLFGLFASRGNLGAQSLVAVEDQPIALGTVTVQRIRSGSVGWIVIYRDESGQPGEVIGFTPVPTGESLNVIVPINIEWATPVLHAILHLDLGIAGTFEYPGPDVRAFAGQRLVTDSFRVLDGVVVTPPVGGEGPSPTPDPTPLPPSPTVFSVTVGDQPFINDTIVVARVVAPQQGWVTIHNDENGQPGMILGAKPVPPEETRNIVIPLNVADATAILHAVLYADLGTPGAFEIPGADIPITVNGQLVSAAFRITGGVTEMLPPTGLPVLQWRPIIVALGTLVGFIGMSTPILVGRGVGRRSAHQRESNDSQPTPAGATHKNDYAEI